MPPADPRAESELTPPPDIRLTVEHAERLAPGFLTLVRRRLRARYPNGAESQPFLYDEVDRAAIDAVVIVPHYEAGGERFVYLRSAVRPPVSLRDAARSPIAEPDARGLWELVAGLVEVSEQHPAGPALAAARELEEELGFRLPAARFAPLGPPTYPAPGVIAERHFFFHVEVEPGERGEPSLDGSALEAEASVACVPLSQALAACRAGRIEDAKTELGLRRLAEHLGERG